MAEENKMKKLLLTILLLLGAQTRAAARLDDAKIKVYMASWIEDAQTDIEAGNLQTLGNNPLVIATIEIAILYYAYLQILELLKRAKLISEATHFAGQVSPVVSILICVYQYI